MISAVERQAFKVVFNEISQIPLILSEEEGKRDQPVFSYDLANRYTISSKPLLAGSKYLKNKNLKLATLQVQFSLKPLRNM